MKRASWLAAMLLLTAALAAGLRFWLAPAGPELATPPTGGDFRLQSPVGPYALADSRGKVVLLYFGYTYCPDICPTSLQTVAQALDGLSADERARVQVLFVSVDPERDTLERLRDYAAFFAPEILPLGGTPQEIAAVAQRYGVYYARASGPEAGNSYVIDHGAFVYLVAPDGRLVASLPHGIEPGRMIEEIRQRLGTNPERKSS